MMYSKNYVLKNEAILILPKRDEYGNLFSVVMETDGPVDVDLSPTALIDFNLRYYGSSLQGARDGAMTILGKVKMNPVTVSERLNLYWLPSMSPTQEGCIWLALHHISDYISIGKKQTQVLFTNGITLIIDMSESTFDKKVQKAYKLKCEMEMRIRETASHVSESKSHYHIAKKGNNINYEIIAYKK